MGEVAGQKAQPWEKGWDCCVAVVGWPVTSDVGIGSKKVPFVKTVGTCIRF